MGADLAIGCSCGSVKGVARGISSSRVNRVVCGCDGCQSYARYLGRADEILDAYGGTDIFQTSPRYIEVTEGIDHIACLRMTPNGALRWYATCCSTPIANTLSTRQVPFIGVLHACVDRLNDKRLVEESLGPVRARVNNADAPSESGTWELVRMILRYGSMLVMWRLRGDHKLSPFFSAHTGEPIVVPRLVGSDKI